MHSAPTLSFVFLILQLSTLPSPQLLSRHHLKTYLDKYSPSIIISYLIVRSHVRPSAQTFLRNLCVLSVSALDYSFSLVFFCFQPSNLQMRILHSGWFLGTFKPSSPNSFTHNSLSDPYPLNPVVSILYKNSGGRGPGLFPVIPGEARDLLFLTSLLRCVVTSIFRKAKPCPPNSALQLVPPSIPTASTSAPKASDATC